MDVSVQLNELEDYMKLNKHTNAVLDNFKNLDNINENDIYDIVYVKQLIKERLDRSIDNDDVKNSLCDTLNRIELIIKLITPDIIKKAKQKSKIISKEDKNKLKHVNKEKYQDVDYNIPLFDLMSAKKKVELRNTSVGDYLRKRFIYLIAVMMLFVFKDFMPDMVNKLVGNANESAVATEAATEAATEVSRFATGFSIIIPSILGIITTILLVTMIITTVFDLMYISLPFVRMRIAEESKEINASLVSSDAQNSVRQGLKEVTTLDVKKQKSLSHIDRAGTIYRNFIESKNEIEAEPADNDEMKLITKIYESDSHKNKEYIENLSDLANAEILYNRYTDKYSKIFNKKLDSKKKALLA